MIQAYTVEGEQALYERILELVQPGDEVIDVGAGRGAYHGLLAHRDAKLTLVDAFEPYLKARRAALPMAKMHLGRAEEILPQLQGPYAVALAIDFIEHLSKEDALALVQQMQRLAGTVAIFTPRGFHPQISDYAGEGADTWQTHRSGWEPEELVALGFDVSIWLGFHDWARSRYPDLPNFDALWAVWRR